MASAFLWAYIVVAEIVFFGWIAWAVKDCRETMLLPITSQATGVTKICCYVVVGLLMVIAAPLALPVMIFLLWKFNRRAQEEHKEKYGRHVELRLEPLHSLNMPEELARYIEEFEPTLVGMNFETLGDFWLKGEPYNSKARIYLSDDLKHFAEIGVTLNTYYCEVISFLENGTVIGSANVPQFCKPFSSEKLGYCVNGVGGNSDMLETIESHLDFVDLASERASEPVRMMSRERWQEYYHYHNRKNGQVRFERGEAIDRPEQCEFPVVVTVQEYPSDNGVSRAGANDEQQTMTSV